MSIKPQTTPVDLLRPSADKVARNRTNEPLDRQNCVDVQGLSESNAPTPKKRISADLDMLQHLPNKMLQSDERVTIRAAFRIGKKVSEQSETVRPRLLKIVSGSKEEASLLLTRKGSLRNSHKEAFSAGLFSSGTSETPRISDGAEEETCSGREQLGHFQRTCDTEERDVVLEAPSHHDGGSNIILANPRQIERSTVECFKVKFFYTNAQYLFSKLDELRMQVADTPPDVIAITETWLSEDEGDCEVALTGYHLFTRDRRGRRVRGVAMYVKSNLTVYERSDKISEDTEAIWLIIKARGSHSLEVVTIYRPPKADPDPDNCLLKSIKEIASRPDVVLMGNFNAPCIQWRDMHAMCSMNTFDYRLLKTTLEALLTQRVLFPTRARGGKQAICPDLVFTKDPDSIDEVYYLPHARSK
ncbi:hypothetical protein SprV_0501777900 [Sparganum proliferum]